MTCQKSVILETCNLSKRFPRVLANENINLKLYKGEIIALLGENGAGKSTLMNVLYGLYRPSAGSILLNGKEVSFRSPREAIECGLGMVHQHFMLVDNLTVTENIILGMEPAKGGIVDYKTAAGDVRELSSKFGLEVDPDVLIEDLSVGLQQRVEILKALYRRARILILDEPTSVLTPQEVEDLFSVIKTLRDSGTSIIVITHKLEEVKAISDRVYILRHGRVSGECRAKETGKEELANLMVGRNVVLSVAKEKHRALETPLFEIDNLAVGNTKGLQVLRELSLKVRPGEIVGIAGVDGNGQKELAEAVMGLADVQSGKLLYDGREITAMSTRKRIENGISYVPADRHRSGLILPFSVAENILMGKHRKRPWVKGITLQREEIERYAEKLAEDFDIRAASVNDPATNLSGGNQQKVILAREITREPKFLLVCQPTRGLDVGAIEYVHSRILEMRGKDVGILLISLELEEIFSLADRILVLYEGRIVKELNPEETDEKTVGFHMTGGGKRERRTS